MIIGNCFLSMVLRPVGFTRNVDSSSLQGGGCRDLGIKRSSGHQTHQPRLGNGILYKMRRL